MVTARLKGRPLERQHRLLRDDGPTVGLLVDMPPLYRAIGSAEVMAKQCARLAEVASMDAVISRWSRPEDPAGHRIADPG